MPGTIRQRASSAPQARSGTTPSPDTSPRSSADAWMEAAMSRSVSRSTRTLARTAMAMLALMLAGTPVGGHAAESYGNCVGYIDTLPATLSTQGVWCLRKDLSTNLATGVAIKVQANNI